MQSDIKSKLVSILKEHVEMEGNLEEIGLEDSLADWGLNSTGVLKLIFGIEKEFEIEFDDDDFDSANFQTLNSLILYINKKIGTIS